MTICNSCGQYIGDINLQGMGHKCSKNVVIVPSPYISPHLVLPVNNQKCDICGSTAIDHTENQCQINRMNKNK